MNTRWLSWIFLLVMGYLIYLGNQAHRVNPAAPDRPANQAAPALANYPKLEAFADGNRWQRALTPGYVGATKITEIKPGQGASAQCGQQVTVQLSGKLSNGQKLEGVQTEAPLHFRLGDAPYAVLNEAVEGMRQGGVRHIVSPPQRVYDETKLQEDVVLDVTLDKLESQEAAPHLLPVKQWVEKEGEGDAAGCGTPVGLEFTLWNAAGNPAYTSEQPHMIAPGKDDMPVALATGLSGMGKGETRSLLLPPQTEKAPALPAAIAQAIANKHVVILTVTRIK